MQSVYAQICLRALLAQYASYVRECNVRDWNFDPWVAAPAPGGLAPLALGILLELRLPRFFPTLRPGRVIGFLQAVVEAMGNSIDNCRHAIDVLQTVTAVLLGMGGVWLFTPGEVLALAFSALCHDLEHPGVTSSFLAATNAPLALRYHYLDDMLERHHSARMLELVRAERGMSVREGCLISVRPLLQLQAHAVLHGLSEAQCRVFREVAVNCILATCMFRHHDIVRTIARIAKFHEERIRNSLSGRFILTIGAAAAVNGAAAGIFSDAHAVVPEAELHSAFVSPGTIDAFQKVVTACAAMRGIFNDGGGGTHPTRFEPLVTHQAIALPQEDRRVLLEGIIHAADISGPAKPARAASRWFNRVVQEFTSQGHRERAAGLEVSDWCATARRAKTYTLSFVEHYVGEFEFPKYRLPKAALFCSSLEQRLSTILCLMCLRLSEWRL